MVELIFLRHGTSVQNQAFRTDAERPENEGLHKSHKDFYAPSLEKIMQEKPNWAFELSEEGKAEASAAGERLAEIFQNRNPEVIFSSKYVRAIETRKLIVESLQAKGVSLESTKLYDHECLNEMLQADENYHTKAEQNLFDTTVKKRIGKYQYRSNGVGMSWQDMTVNARIFLQTLALEFPDIKTVVVVGHGNWQKAFDMLLENIPLENLEDFVQKKEVYNCTPVHYEGNSWFRLKKVS